MHSKPVLMQEIASKWIMPASLKKQREPIPF